MKSFYFLLFTAFIFSAKLAAANQAFSSVKSVDRFVDQKQWTLVVNGKSRNTLDFKSNHTLPAGKAIKLGSQEYRYWGIIKHPKKKGQYQLRIRNENTRGWHFFNWNAAKKAWISPHWPRHQIKLKN